MGDGFEIRLDDLRGAPIQRLLEAHLDLMRSISPPESVHALDLDALRAPEVSFWTVWDGADLLGCGALTEIEQGHGEVKSMHVAQAHRRRGVAARMVSHILAVARERELSRLSLETGSTEHFRPARELYARFGFQACGPFADYAPDPHSFFMTLALDGPDGA